MGGFYEPLIRILISHIKKLLGKLILSRNQLELLLFEVECGQLAALDIRSKRVFRITCPDAVQLSVNNRTSSHPRAEILAYDPREGSGGASKKLAEVSSISTLSGRGGMSSTSEPCVSFVDGISIRRVH